MDKKAFVFSKVFFCSLAKAAEGPRLDFTKEPKAYLGLIFVIFTSTVSPTLAFGTIIAKSFSDLELAPAFQKARPEFLGPFLLIVKFNVLPTSKDPLVDVTSVPED